MPALRVFADVEGPAGAHKQVTVTFQAAPTGSGWPAAWTAAGHPQPVKPTGLTVDTTGVFKPGQSNRLYRGGTFDCLITTEKNLVFENCHFTWFGINGPAQDIWFEGGDTGPRGNAIHPMLGPGGGFGGPPPKNITFKNHHFHGMHQATQNDHTEGLQIGAVSGLWLDGCPFDDNHVFDLFFNSWDTVTEYILVENGPLAKTSTIDGSSFYTVLIGSGVDASPVTGPGIIRNCTLGQSISVDPVVKSRWDVANNKPIGGRGTLEPVVGQVITRAEARRIAERALAYMQKRLAER